MPRGCPKFPMEKVYPLNVRVRRSYEKNDDTIVASRRVIRDFVKNTSIHGFKYLDEETANGRRIAQLFWACTLVLAFAGSGMLLRVLWDRYQSNPMITVVESFHVPTFGEKFPALTVCPIVNPERKKRDEALANLRLPTNISRDEAADLIKNIFDLAHRRSDAYEQQLRLNEIFDINGLEMMDFLKMLRGNCQDVVESCWWNEKNIDCARYFREFYATEGLCCSFNYRLEDSIDRNRMENSTTDGIIPTANYGMNSGLTMVFKEKQFIVNHDNGSIARTTSNTIGLLVYVHEQYQYPNTYDIMLQAGQEMQLAAYWRKKQNTPGLSRKNELPCVTENHSDLRYMRVYSETNCHNSCRIKAALSVCGCVPWQFRPFAIVDDSPICEFRQFKCIRENYKEIWSVIFAKSTKVKCCCPERCESGLYVLKHTEIPLAATTNFAPSPIYRNITNEKAIVRLFIAREIGEAIRSLSMTNEVNMLSSVGGIFSLFLGCSILSLVEIAYFLFIFIVSCYSIGQGN